MSGLSYDMFSDHEALDDVDATIVGFFSYIFWGRLALLLEYVKPFSEQ